MLHPCSNPDCEHPANSDPEISIGFCCEKCEARFNGEDWGMAGKKHTAYCTSKYPNDDAGGYAAPSYGPAGGYAAPSYGPAGGYAAPSYGPARRAPQAKCAHPDCEYMKNSDQSISINFCCEKCEARAKGEEWGMAGKRHTAYCSSKTDVASFDSGQGAGGAGYGAPSYDFAGSMQGKCAHPECEYMQHSDPSVSAGYCCEKCEGLDQGADWAEGGKRHYKSCEKIEFSSSSFGPGEMGGAGSYGKGAASKQAWGMAQHAFMPYEMPGKGWGKEWKGSKGWGKDATMGFGEGSKGWGKDATMGFGDSMFKGGAKASKGLMGASGKGFGKGVGGKWGQQQALQEHVHLPPAKGLRNGGKASEPSLDDHPSENKVLVSNLQDGITLEEISEYFSLTGGTILLAKLMKGSSGGVAYASAEEASEAIALLNGSHFGGSEIVVGVWTGN